MKITMKELARIISESREFGNAVEESGRRHSHRVGGGQSWDDPEDDDDANESERQLVEYSEYESWNDLLDSLDDISEMLDSVAAQYSTSGWLVNNGAEDLAQKLEDLYRSAEGLSYATNKAMVQRGE